MDYIFRVEEIERDAKYRMSFLTSDGRLLEEQYENCMDDVLIHMYKFERYCYDIYCEGEESNKYGFNTLSNTIRIDWKVKTMW